MKVSERWYSDPALVEAGVFPAKQPQRNDHPAVCQYCEFETDDPQFKGWWVVDGHWMCPECYDADWIEGDELIVIDNQAGDEWIASARAEYDVTEEAA